MLKPGLYHARHEEYPGFPCPAYDYHVVLRVRETPRAFSITLVELNTRYGATQIQDLFRTTKNVLIRKEGSKHALTVWDDESFTLYPYRVGVPYYFTLGGPLDK